VRTMAIMVDNNGIWSLKTNTANRVTKVNGLVDTLDLLAKSQGLSTTGATDTKNNQRVVAGNQSYHVESNLKSYYLDNNDPTSLAIIDFTMTEFTQGSIENSIKKMQLIYDTAAAIIKKTPTAFDGYNMEPTDLSELQTDIDALSGAAIVPLKMRSGNKSVTQEIVATFELLRTEMNGLDVNIETYRKSQPEFVNLYMNGRRQVQVGVGHKTAEVALMPIHFEAVMGLEYTLGDKLTIRNHSAFTLKWGFTNTPGVLPTVLNDLDGKADINVEIVKDASGSFGHWLILHNANEFDDVNATVLLAKA